MTLTQRIQLFALDALTAIFGGALAAVDRLGLGKTSLASWLEDQTDIYASRASRLDAEPVMTLDEYRKSREEAVHGHST